MEGFVRVCGEKWQNGLAICTPSSMVVSSKTFEKRTEKKFIAKIYLKQAHSSGRGSERDGNFRHHEAKTMDTDQQQ